MRFTGAVTLALVASASALDNQLEARALKMATDWEVVTVTQVVTVTAGQQVSSVADAAAAVSDRPVAPVVPIADQSDVVTSSFKPRGRRPIRNRTRSKKKSSTSAAPAQPTQAPVPTAEPSSQAAPEPSAEPSSQAAPEPSAEPSPEPSPEPSSEPAPEPEQPAPSSQYAPSPTAQAPGALASTYQEAVVLHHNLARRKHNVSDVTWSDAAYKSALRVSQTCVYEHSPNEQRIGYGENIGNGYGPSKITDFIDGLYSEVAKYEGQYGSKQPTDWKPVGHFTQMVWRTTKEIGCATTTCDGGPLFTVCHYGPPGNFQGDYAKNVLPPIDGSTWTPETGVDVAVMKKGFNVCKDGSLTC